MKILALDIGGTAVKYGLCRDEHISFGQFSVKNSDGYEDIPQSICTFSKEHMPDVIAISAPGPFDYETGTSHMTHKLLSMYRISMKEELKKALPAAKTIFLHDSTAFAIGVLDQKPELKEKDAALIMLGTGLGYTVLHKGKVLLNRNQTPLHPLWNKPLFDGISEDYVSTRALVLNAEKCGYAVNSVLDIAKIARTGNEKMLRLFYHYGRNLGLCVMEAKKTDRFSEIVFGGQISCSFDLIREGFESVCRIKYSVADYPERCAVYGLITCAADGKESYCRYEE